MGALGAALLKTLLAPAALAAAPPGAGGCMPIPGWDQVLAKPAVQWIVIGELHGTEETPAIFADAVCLTAEKRGPVVVALEVPSSDQAAVDDFIASDGGSVAQTRLLKALLWHMPMKDGRSSEAYFRLFEQLRRMHREGRVAKVIAFQDSRPAHDPPGDQGPYDKRLAAMVRNAAGPGTTVVALVGSTHASKTKIPVAKPFLPMAANLPSAQTLTLIAVGSGGTAWNCQIDGCGSHQNLAVREPVPRGVELHPVMDGAYDGVLNLGGPTTASPPQPAP